MSKSHKKYYALMAGGSAAEYAWMTDEQLKEAQEKAKIATDGDCQWVLVSELLSEDQPIDEEG
ncbi:MAG: hypothetical protein KAF91_16245 [Nostoc sp. TH1S01]|nr:hypothetical protein [Nostoc sp. TH1S01]